MNSIGMVHVRQSFPRPTIPDIEAAVKSELLNGPIVIPAGARIALTGGSRGVANIDRIIRAAVEALKEMGARPFVIPAMGSHGGATAEGQREVLASYGVTEKRIGTEILSSMEVVEIPAPCLENRVFMDRHAWESDGVILLNRVKPHTDFRGRWESGLVKMAVIGLGKRHLAEELHSFGVRGLRDMIPPTARVVLETGKIVGAIGVVENAYDDTMKVETFATDQILEGDAKLLEIAKEHSPRLPLSEIDLLIIDVMGKDISGTGVDTNVIGRISIRGEEDPVTPDIRSVLITDLSEASHGNATGVGLADVITKNLYRKIDYDATYMNSITSSFLERCKIPLVAETDAAGVEIALRAANCRRPEEAWVVRIRSTLDLSNLLVSESAWIRLEGREDVERLSDPEPLLGDDGFLRAFPESDDGHR